MQRIFKYVLAIMATLLMPLAMLATAAPAQAAVSEVQVLNANIGGANVAGSGIYANGLAPAGTLLRMMQDRPDIDAVTVQEICRNQAVWLSQYTGWSYAFTPMTHEHENTGAETCANDQKGQAVLTTPLSFNKFWEGTHELGNVDNGKEFRGLCVGVKGLGFNTETLLICTAHLWSGAAGYDEAFNKAKRNSQSANLMAWLEPSTTPASEHKVIFGADMNSTPLQPAIDQVHRVQHNGTINSANKFWEVDQSRIGSAWGCNGDATTVCRAGRPTSGGRKIDYLFASEDGMDRHEGLTATLVNQSAGVGGSNAAPHDFAIAGEFRWTNTH